MATSLARDLMSDEEWAFHERLILTVRAPNGRKPTNHRLVLDGVFWIARTESPSRYLPEAFGKWSSVYRQFRRWTLAGLWEEIMDALNESGLAPDALQMIDIEPVNATGSREAARGSAPIIRLRAQTGDSATGFWPFKGWLRDQDPPARQRCGPADEIGHHARADIGRPGLRSGHGHQPARTERPAGRSRL